MNLETNLTAPNDTARSSERSIIKLTVDDFLMLRERGAFADYSKAELLDGELWGVPVPKEDQPESDASYPIKLRILDYSALDGAGAFKSCGRTELIDGVVFAMSPQHRPHGFLKDELAYRLRRALEAMGSPLHVATEQSVVIEPYSEPDPDIILTTEPRGEEGIPIASVALIVEIADSSRRFDIGEKSNLYARAKLPEYWVADVNARVIHRMWSPDSDGYAQWPEPTALGETIAAATIEGLKVETAGL